MKTLIGAFAATVLLLATTAVASDLKGPQFDSSKLFGFGATSPTENWTLSLGGGGATTTTSDSQTVFGFDAQLGHTDTVFLPGEVGIRQGLGWATTPNKNGGDWQLSTTLYQDWKVLSYKSFDLYAGGNAAILYGNRTAAWTLSPEVEARLWLKKDVYTFFRTEYAFNVTETDIKSQDAFRYILGFGVRF